MNLLKYLLFDQPCVVQEFVKTVNKIRVNLFFCRACRSLVVLNQSSPLRTPQHRTCYKRLHSPGKRCRTFISSFKFLYFHILIIKSPHKSLQLFIFSIGSFSNADGNGNQNANKALGLMTKTTTLHVHYTFVHFFAVTARLGLEMS